MFQGVLQKMLTEWADPIRYYLPMQGDYVLMNNLLGKAIAKSAFLKSLKLPIG